MILGNIVRCVSKRAETKTSTEIPSRLEHARTRCRRVNNQNKRFTNGATMTRYGSPLTSILSPGRVKPAPYR